MPKGRVAITQEFYDKIVDAFRVDPTNYTAAAKLAGIGRNTAKRGWNLGWPDKGYPPIKDTLELEALEARKDRAVDDEARLASLKEQEGVSDAHLRALARRDAIRARGEEGKMVKAARVSAIQLLEVCQKLTTAINDIAPKVAEAVRRIELTKASINEIDAIGRIIWRLAISTRAGSATAFQILQAERLLLGQPTDIIGITDLDNMDEDDALNELEEAAKSLGRIKRRRAGRLQKADLRVIEGGANGKKNGSVRSA